MPKSLTYLSPLTVITEAPFVAVGGSQKLQVARPLDEFAVVPKLPLHYTQRVGCVGRVVQFTIEVFQAGDEQGRGLGIPMWPWLCLQRALQLKLMPGRIVAELKQSTTELTRSNHVQVHSV